MCFSSYTRTKKKLDGIRLATGVSKITLKKDQRFIPYNFFQIYSTANLDTYQPHNNRLNAPAHHRNADKNNIWMRRLIASESTFRRTEAVLYWWAAIETDSVWTSCVTERRDDVPGVLLSAGATHFPYAGAVQRAL